MKSKTKKLMLTYALPLELGSIRAQCLNIANLSLNNDETIAARIKRDHSDSSSHLRAASLMQAAGAATETKRKKYSYGTFTFEDGSTF